MVWCIVGDRWCKKVNIGGGGAAGSVYVGVAFGGKKSSNTNLLLVQKNIMELHGLQ